MSVYTLIHIGWGVLVCLPIVAALGALIRYWVAIRRVRDAAPQLAMERDRAWAEKSLGQMMSLPLCLIFMVFLTSLCFRLV